MGTGHAQGRSEHVIKRVWIGPHVLERMRKHVHYLATSPDAVLRKLCIEAVRDGAGEQRLLHPSKKPSLQQVAQPLLNDDLNPVGYFVLDQDKQGEYDVIVKTFLTPFARQILAGEPRRVPLWYRDFQFRRKW